MVIIVLKECIASIYPEDKGIIILWNINYLPD